MSSEQFDYDVFISYSHKDEDWVHQWLLFRLKAAGLRTCIDVEDFEVGAPSVTEMERAVIQSTKTLLVLTPEYLASEWTEFENILVQTLDPAARRRRVLPLLLKDCERPLRIAALTYADFRTESRREAQLKRVVAAITGEAKRSAAERDGGSGLQPLPPQPDFAHPYPLQKHFTGRVAYRKLLTQWLTAADCPIFSLTAIGGTGKSALAWAWVQRDVLGRTVPDVAADSPEDADACRLPADSRPEGILWWSFYERESAFSAFLDEAITYTSRGQVDLAKIPSDYDKTKQLLQLLQSRRFLLILDGFERQLRAYTSLNAPYQGEVEEDERGDFRSCANPHLARFLQDAASLNIQSRLLLTTRLFPRDLDGTAGCDSTPLEGLDPQDAVAFFHAYGIKGIPSEIQAACAPYGYHPLALRLLAGSIIKDKQNPGDVKAAERYSVIPNLKGKEQHHVLEPFYNALRKPERTLLSRIAAFRSAVGYDALVVLNPYTLRASFDAALDDLIDRGLLFHDRERNSYDLHPVVRQFAYDHLADKGGTHTRLRDYFATIPTPDKIESLDDLASVIELYHHTVRAGSYDAAWALLNERKLSLLLPFRLDARQTYIELARSLFPDGESNPPTLADDHAQAVVLNNLADAYRVSGQPGRALPLHAMAVAICERTRRNQPLALALGPMSSTQMHLGQLAAAYAGIRRSLGLSRATGDQAWEAIHNGRLGTLLAYQGLFEQAAQRLDSALLAFSSQRDLHGRFIGWTDYAFRALLMRDPVRAAEAARRARQLADELGRSIHPPDYDLALIGWLQGASLVALAAEEEAKREEHLTEAESHLTEALTRSRRVNLVEFEPDILLAWAKWHHLKGDPAQARKHANEALSIADRCEYRLKQADCHNYLAALDQQEGNMKSAIDHARTAYERAWCDGPPHCYKPALDQATRLLESLHTDPPPIP